MRGQTYSKGVGMRVPANLLYEVKPEYDRFVARVGVDGNLLNRECDTYGQHPGVPPGPRRPLGCLTAQQPSVQFRVFIDGELAAESPVMRSSQEPWRFDVQIPRGARRINLTVTDAGSRNLLDLADWADAGFVLGR